MAPRGTLLLLVVLAACSESHTGTLAWRVRFESPELRDRAAFVRAEIRDGSCAGTSVSYRSTIARGSVGTMVPAVSPGRYGFAAVAIDADCSVFAEHCEEISLPSDTGTVDLLLRAVEQRPLCEGATCGSDCAAPPDTIVDAGPDIGSRPDVTVGGNQFPCGLTSCEKMTQGCAGYQNDPARSHCFPIPADCSIFVISGGSCPCSDGVCDVQGGCSINGDGSYTVTCSDG